MRQMTFVLALVLAQIALITLLVVAYRRRARRRRTPKEYDDFRGALRDGNELAALSLLATFRAHFGWAGPVFVRRDVEDRLGRHLTDEEWTAVSAQPAWRVHMVEPQAAIGWAYIDQALTTVGLVPAATSPEPSIGPQGR